MRSACSSSNDPTAPPSERSEAVTPQPARHAPAALPPACGRRRSTNRTDRSLVAAAGCGRRSSGGHGLLRLACLVLVLCVVALAESPAAVAADHPREVSGWDLHSVIA